MPFALEKLFLGRKFPIFLLAGSEPVLRSTNTHKIFLNLHLFVIIINSKIFSLSYEELKPRDNNTKNSTNDSDGLKSDINMDNESLNSGSFNQPTSLMGAVLPPTNEQQEALALKKALEWELSLDSRDLRSHAWYHGPLPRQRAEEIVQREGDFLIRDCTSQPDNYVLTCRTKTAVLHFVINKVRYREMISIYDYINQV